MNAIRCLKSIIKKVKQRYSLVIDLPQDSYKDLIQKEEIDNIIHNMPTGLSKIEKAYYVYIELGKLLKENPWFVFSNLKEKYRYYNTKIDDRDWYAICKSAIELYVSILRDESIGVEADVVRKWPDYSITHVDAVLRIDENYVVNIMNDLCRIKTGRRINGFCFDLKRPVTNAEIKEDNEIYLNRLRNHYKKISCLTRKDIEQFDKKLGYSYFSAKFMSEDERGIYTDDVIELLKKDMDNPESFREYVLHNKEVPEEKILKYKLDYIFENIDKFTYYNGDRGYIENILYYLKLEEKLLSKEERDRIQAYAISVENDLGNIISIIKVKPLNRMSNTNNRNIYYLYSQEDARYIEKTPQEIREFIERFKDRAEIVGNYYWYKQEEIGELEF